MSAQRLYDIEQALKELSLTQTIENKIGLKYDAKT